MSCGPAFRDVFGVNKSTGQKVISGLHVPNINCADLRCTRLWINGVMGLGGSGTFADGTVSLPGIAFTNELSTGIYRPATGKLGFTGVGVSLGTWNSAGLALGTPLTTTAGDLIINPVGSNVDFSGKTLVNVGGISSNPNRYEV